MNMSQGPPLALPFLERFTCMKIAQKRSTLGIVKSRSRSWHDIFTTIYHITNCQVLSALAHVKML